MCDEGVHLQAYVWKQKKRKLSFATNFSRWGLVIQSMPLGNLVMALRAEYINNALVNICILC